MELSTLVGGCGWLRGGEAGSDANGGAGWGVVLGLAWFGKDGGDGRPVVVGVHRWHCQVDRADRGASRRPAHEMWAGWPQRQQKRGWELDRLAMVFAHMEHLSGPEGLRVATAGIAGVGSVACAGGGVGVVGRCRVEFVCVSDVGVIWVTVRGSVVVGGGARHAGQHHMLGPV